MKQFTQTFPAEIEGVEIEVTYEYEVTHVPGDEYCTAHDLIYTDVISVKVMTHGKGVDIYPHLTRSQVKAYDDAVKKNHPYEIYAY